MSNASSSPNPSGNNTTNPVEHIAIWVTILASIGGLVFTGLSLREQAEATRHAGKQTASLIKQTKYQGDTYSDQIAQQEKRQARLINIWPRSSFTDERRAIVLINRSNEPAYRFRVYISLADKFREKENGDMAVLSLGTLPPCTKLEFDLNAAALVDPETTQALKSSKLMDYGVLFVDSAGKAFHRHAAGEINPNPWLEFLHDGTRAPDIPDVFKKFTPYGLEGDKVSALSSKKEGVLAGPSKAESCGDDS